MKLNILKEIDINQVKKIQLEILVAVDDFCNRNGIRYSLSSGTLIGAIRHQGYIPWDDDIDIMMPRSDYDLFIKIFNGSYPNLSLMAPELNANYYAPYANIYDNRTLLTEGDNGHHGFNIGVKIDIFPIDHVAEDIKKYKRELLVVKYINYIMYIKRLNNTLIRDNDGFSNYLKLGIKKIVCLWLPYCLLQKLVIMISNNQRYYHSTYVDNVVYNVYTSRLPRFRSTIMESYIRVPFEGHYFNSIAQYDDVLKKMYGDYMILPPEEDRVAHHNFKAYWLK